MWEAHSCWALFDEGGTPWSAMGLKITVLPDEPAAPAFDPSKDWEWSDEDGEWQDGQHYQGELVNGGHMVLDELGDYKLASAVRNIEPKPEPAHVESPEVVAWAVMFGELSHALRYSREDAERCARLVNGTVRPLTFADVPKDKKNGVSCVEIFEGDGL